MKGIKGIIQFCCTSTITTIDLSVGAEPLLVDRPSLSDAGFRDGNLVEVSTEDDPDAKIWMKVINTLWVDLFGIRPALSRQLIGSEAPPSLAAG